MRLDKAIASDRRFALVSFICFLVLALITFLFSLGGDRPTPPSNGGLVFSQLTQTPRQITITTSRDRYSLAQGEDGIWRNRDKGGFPVSEEKAIQLIHAITEARYERPATALPERHDLLGLGSPTSGGTGANLSLAEMPKGVLIGVKDGRTYGRKPNENQTWRLSEAFPPLHASLWWINIDMVGLPTDEQIIAVEVTEDGAEPVRVDYSETLSGNDMVLLYASGPLRLIDVGHDTLSPEQIHARHTVFYSDGTKLHFDLANYNGGAWTRLSGDALARPDLAEGRIFRLEPLAASELVPY